MSRSENRPVLRALLAGVALTGTAITIAAPASAATEETSGQPVAQHAAATTESEEDRIAAYWTAERMRSAIPASTMFTGNKTMGNNGKHKGHHKDGRGNNGKHKGHDNGNGKGRGHDKGGGNDGGDGGNDGGGAISEAVPAEERPEFGKVFFTLNGTRYVCSATVTQSANADVVTTAGHCVHEGPGSFATKWTFVPAYENGNAPYGKWTAEKLFTTKAWASSGDFTHDVGFAVMNENDAGKSISDVTGSLPIAFNLARGLTYTAYGYPAAAPFDGQTLYKCRGSVTTDPNTGSQGLKCNMTGGSSGGGWITESGKINSVNSYKYSGDNSTMYGPYFGDKEQNVYQQAASY